MTKQPKENGFDLLYDRFVKGDKAREAEYAQYEIDLEVSQKIYDLRKKAKLTQKQLAEKVGTTPSVISRLESADYKGHSLSMLNRIAFALDKRVEVRLVPIKKKK